MRIRLKLRLLIAPLSLLALLVFPAAGQAAELADEGDLVWTVGEEDFVRYCGACHGPEGKGDGRVTPGLQKKPSDLSTLSQRHGGNFPYFYLRQIIDGRGAPESAIRFHGHGQMPVWGQIFRDETGSDAVAKAKILHIIDYLHSIQK